jgi:hypothetical protein
MVMYLYAAVFSALKKTNAFKSETGNLLNEINVTKFRVKIIIRDKLNRRFVPIASFTPDQHNREF